MSVSDYINKLRVDYSVQVINEHPNWTIDAIAEMCGYVRRATYYSHFNRRFGITPAQYRNELAKKS
jgi:transcriptional regulator GlxA family with amidase domain